MPASGRSMCPTSSEIWSYGVIEYRSDGPNTPILRYSHTPMRFDPIQVEVWRHLFASIAEEMGATLERTGFSPNIKERLDHSCALFDSEGRRLAQASHIPVHLGAMPLMMQRIIHKV